MRIGLVSDTHGLWRPEAEAFLRGSDAIIHAGDIGKPAILEALQAIAPVHAVRGNNDTGTWAEAIPHALTVDAGGVCIFVLHDLKELKLHPAPANARVIVCGHSHKALVQQQAGGVLLVNPGSAGPRRFKLPVTAAELLVSPGGEVRARIVPLL